MQRIPSSLPTVRLVDIDKEILKGKTVKPGLLNDDVTPGPSKIAKLTETNENVSFLPQVQSPVTNTFILSQGMPALAPIGSPAMTTYILNTAPVGNVSQHLVTRSESEMKCVIAKEQPAATQSKSVPPILRRGPQLVTQTVPVEKMWSEIKNGVRFVHPSNLDHDVLNKVMDTLKTKKSLKNTIISLPNSVYLVPLSCFKGAPLPVDSMVSIGSDETQEISDETDEVTTKLKHPCWSNKRHRKLDLDGFSAYDRLGFYKSDSQRSKKCQKNVDSIIESLRNSIVKIQDELLYLDSVEQKSKKKLQKRKAEQSEQNKKRRRRRKKFFTEPTPAFSPKTSFETVTTEQLVLIGRRSMHVINHLNFESYVHHRSSLFVSKDSVVTEMILNIFPDFREAVDNGVVKIATEADFISVFGVESVEHDRQVEEDLNKHERFAKFLKDNHQLLHVLSDHSYAVNNTHRTVN